MRKFALIVLSHLLFTAIHSQSAYWQQQVNYTIDVSLDDKDHSLTAFEKIEYINHSPDTLKFIWFHIWPNAYKNDKTAYTDQDLENGSTKFYFSNKEDKGYINRLDFKVNNITAQTEDHPQYIDIIKVLLPSPLAPGQQISITTPFHVKLPYNFSRGGHDGQSYQVTQWYPKPAVYDKEGWHPMPYLDQGEFYSEFGSFDVSITVPDNYVVAATGDLQNEAEKKWMKEKAEAYERDLKVLPVAKPKNIFAINKKDSVVFPPSSTHFKTLQYKQNNIHDFAWFADKRFIINTDTCKLASGKIIQVYTYYTATEAATWQHSVKYCKDAVRHYSSLVGEYPFNIVQAVQGPQSFGGGMEYPTITIISPTSSARELDYVIAHEIGHNWFYGILGTNERQHPWMDEGINSYYESRYKQSKSDHFTDNAEQALLESVVAERKDQPIETAAGDFSVVNYDLIAYYKTSRWMNWLRHYLGTDAFNHSMQEYYKEWQFKHPQPEDFKRSLEKASGRNLDSAFALLQAKGNLPDVVKKGTIIKGPVSPNMILGGNPEKNSVITFFPAIGANSYDRFMIGLGVTNLRLPPNRLQFFATGMYATGSKKMTGIGFINYDFFPKGIIHKVDIGVSGSTFTVDELADNNGKKTYLGFSKIVPGIRLTFKQKNPRSTMYRFVQFKSYLVNEDGLSFYRDTVINGIDTTITNKFRTVSESRTLNQLKIVIGNNRALYPYQGELRLDQGKDFIRAAFTGNYFFNYPKGGGLNVRLFAGKFIYLSPKTYLTQFKTDRVHLNMTGANGYEDYTYSDYFIGRNKFEGLPSQQIMVRDGGFKVRTDLLAEKVGKTDDWLAAVNFSTTIPNSINPLNLLPVKIPLRLFLDIGTYAETWKPNATADRFIYDAGIHIPFLKETVNIYIPLLYSKVYSDYIKSTIAEKGRFWKKISFSIDISNFSFRKIDRNLDF